MGVKWILTPEESPKSFSFPGNVGEGVGEITIEANWSDEYQGYKLTQDQWIPILFHEGIHVKFVLIDNDGPIWAEENSSKALNFPPMVMSLYEIQGYFDFAYSSIEEELKNDCSIAS